MRLLPYLGLFISSIAAAYPRGGALDRCEYALAKAGGAQVDAAAKEADILRERLLANSEFPQADFGIGLHLMSTYLRRPLSASELLGEPSPKEIEAVGKAMNGFHETCLVRLRTEGHPEAKVRSTVTPDDLASLVRFENRNALYTLKSVASALGAKMPGVSAEPNEWAAAMDQVFLKPELEATAKELNRVGVAVAASLKAPAVKDAQTTYLKFLRDSELKGIRDERTKAFGPVQSAIRKALRETLTRDMPELARSDRLESVLDALD